MKLFQPEALLFLQKKGIKLAERRAKQGLVDYQYLVGIAYYLGTGGVVPDQALSRLWIDQAASAGHAAAQFFLGTLLMKGEWLPHQDPDGSIPLSASEEAIFWFRKSADKKHPGSLTSLGNTITDRLIQMSKPDSWWNKRKKKTRVKETVSEEEAASAIDLYQQAIEHQYSAAHYFLGLHYLNGWGTHTSRPDALRVFMDGERLGDADCAWMLGVLHERTPATEGSYFSKWVKNRSSKVTTESLVWYQKAAERGHKEALHIMGLACLDHMADALLGLDDNTRDKKAVAYLQQAALRGWGPSMSILSDLYKTGWKDQKPVLSQSYAWAFKAAAKGTMPKLQLKILWSQMTTDEKETAKKIIEEPDEVKEWLHSITL